MVMMYPHNSDWDYIAKLMNDPTWHSKNMHKYFKRLERCEYIPKWKFWSRLWSRHGFDGWLPTSIGDSTMLRQDKVLKKLIGAAFKESLSESWLTTPNPINRLFRLILKLRSRLDPNHWRLIRRNLEGLFHSRYDPSLQKGRTREYHSGFVKNFLII
jgi:choline dehydrogenase